jgi:hypothetical protein
LEQRRSPAGPPGWCHRAAEVSESVGPLVRVTRLGTGSAPPSPVRTGWQFNAARCPTC